MLLCIQYLHIQQLLVRGAVFFFLLSPNRQMATPAVKGVTKMGVREYTKKEMKNGKEIARIGIYCICKHFNNFHPLLQRTGNSA